MHIYIPMVYICGVYYFHRVQSDTACTRIYKLYVCMCMRVVNVWLTGLGSDLSSGQVNGVVKFSSHVKFPV